MSAINLQRLRTQLDLLLPQIGNLIEFLYGLREIYNFYADHTHPVSEPPTGVFTLPAFNTPPVLTREVLLRLTPYTVAEPDLVLELIDLLWQEPEVELRQLAAQLLGKLPAEKFDQVIDRIRTWSETASNPELLPFLHQQASIGIREHAPQRWLDLLYEWETSANNWLVKLAIQGVIPLIDDEDYENLPAIFTFITQLIINPGSEFQFDLLTIIQHLAKRSEVETVYHLKKAITLSSDPGMPRFIRRTLEYFSPDMQTSLRNASRERI
jgi:hypothetical protein